MRMDILYTKCEYGHIVYIQHKKLNLSYNPVSIKYGEHTPSASVNSQKPVGLILFSIFLNYILFAICKCMEMHIPQRGKEFLKLLQNKLPFQFPILTKDKVYRIIKIHFYDPAQCPSLPASCQTDQQLLLLLQCSIYQITNWSHPFLSILKLCFICMCICLSVDTFVMCTCQRTTSGSWSSHVEFRE